MNAQGVIISVIIFMVGIVLALPDEVNIGVMILEELQKNLDSNVDLSGTIISLKILGVFLIIGDVVNIVLQAKKGNWW